MTPVRSRRLRRMAGRVLPTSAIQALRRSAWRVGLGGRGKLLRLLPENSKGAEIGVWRGDFSETLLRHVNPLELHLIDPWRYEPTYRYAWYGGGLASCQTDMDHIHAEVRERFDHESRVIIRRAGSLEAVKEYSDRYFDWIYLDADHSYEAVIADLDAWLPKVRSGGLICCDDYGVVGWWQDGVTRAVCSILRNSTLVPRLVLEGQVVLEKP